MVLLSRGQASARVHRQRLWIIGMLYIREAERSVMIGYIRTPYILSVDIAVGVGSYAIVRCTVSK